MNVLSSAAIDGVVVQPLEFVDSSRGDMMQIQRAADGPGCAQIFITCNHSGEVKGWYRHAHRDRMAVVCGLIKLVLYDSRPGSPTHGKINEIALGDVAPRLVQIPAGVWHGFKVLSADVTYLLHLSASLYDIDSPQDEHLPVDDPSIPYKW